VPPDWRNYSEPVEKPATSPVWLSSSHFITYKVIILLETVQCRSFLSLCFSFYHIRWNRSMRLVFWKDPRFPPIWSPERCIPWYEVWDWCLYDLCSENLVICANPWYRHCIQTLILVGTRPQKWTDAVWKSRMWRRTITLHTVKFLWFRNKYLLRKKSKGHCFLGKPHTYHFLENMWITGIHTSKDIFFHC